MCGRLVLTSDYREKIKAIFADIEADDWLPPNYNVSPTQQIPAVLDAAPHRLQWLAWGFAATQPGRAPLINARSETAHELPSFREAFTSHRAIVLADGFYEWKRDPSRKTPQPYFFKRADGGAFALAALWQQSQPARCVLLTTEANQCMLPVHDRMPVIFTPDAARLWLCPETAPETLRAILQPFPSARMTCHPVSERVNRSSAAGASLIEPVRIYEQGSFL